MRANCASIYLAAISKICSTLATLGSYAFGHGDLRGTQAFLLAYWARLADNTSPLVLLMLVLLLLMLLLR